MTDRERLLDDAIRCARLAGTAAMEYFRQKDRIESRNKLNDSDIVTVADRVSESIIKDFITRHYPEHSIMSEESELIDGDAPWRWVIDPIDGTSNFFAGLPLWSVSIGLEYRGATEIGVVYIPVLDELFYSSRGCGAFLNGRRITVAKENTLSKVLVSTGFPVDKATNINNNLDSVERILPKVRDLRRLGSASIDMCYVAAGYLGGYWELNLHLWDICASTLIVNEAGGTVTRYRDDRNISVVCGNEKIHDQLLDILRQ